MADASALTTQRIVPGAPPPISIAKAQKKRRKPKAKSGEDSPAVVVPDPLSAALTEKAPQTADIVEGNVAPELLVKAESQDGEDLASKPSPIVELITKRLKATNKKIVRLFPIKSCRVVKLSIATNSHLLID